MVKPLIRFALMVASFVGLPPALAQMPPGQAAREETVGAAQLPLAQVVQSHFIIPEKPVWVGEIFPLTYVVEVDRAAFYNLGGEPEWTAEPLTVEDWSKPQLSSASAQGGRSTIRYVTQAVSSAPGPVSLRPAQQKIQLKTGTIARGAVIEPKTETFSVASATAQVTARELPSPVPPSFSGAVGRFTLTSSVSAASIVAGEPVTWTVTLDGRGNWPYLAGLPPRAVSKDFRALNPTVRRTSRGGSLFDGALIEDVVLVSTRPGSYQLGPVAFTVFDPEQGKYVLLTSPALAVAVTPAPTTAAGAAGGMKTAGEGASAEEEETVKPTAPLLPRDPLPLGNIASRPLSAADEWRAVAWMLAAVLAVWLAFAVHRARLTDPLRPRRQARVRMLAITHRLRRGAAGPEEFGLVRQWQREARVFWDFRPLVPRAESFESARGWSEIWREADALLYSQSGGAVQSWAGRAHSAVEARTLPRFSPLAVFRPENLTPLFVVIAAALIVVGATHLDAADFAATYQRGDFATAEVAARAALKLHPNDWGARYNLSLALSQLGRWDEAVAQAAAAFVHHPGDASVRWQLSLAAQRASYRPEAVESFLDASGMRAMAATCSPADWQRMSLASLGLSALGLIVALSWIYGHVSQRAKWIALGLVVAGLLGAASAGVCVRMYGPLAGADAAVVWRASTLRSIPVEGEVPQETSPLPAGTVVTRSKTFLGWSRLVFPHGETGWARTDDLIPLWAGLPANDVK